MISIQHIYERLQASVIRQIMLIVLIVAVVVLVSDAECLADNKATSFLDTFKSNTQGWWATLRGYALVIFKWTLMLEIALFGARVALQHSNVGEIFQQFVWVLLFAAFIYVVIIHWEDWSQKVAITGLKSVAEDLTPYHADAGNPLALATTVWERVCDVVNQLSGNLHGMMTFLVLEILALIICIILALISALYILVTCEFYIVANVGILLIGLGGSKIFKDYAINVMRYVLSVAIKLFVLQLIVNIGLTILSMWSIRAAIGYTGDVDFGKLFMLIAQAIILLCLAKSLPETVGGIISGSHISGVQTLGNAAQLARIGGATGVLGTIKGMGQEFQKARNTQTGIKAQQNPTIANIMKSQLTQARAEKRGE